MENFSSNQAVNDFTGLVSRLLLLLIRLLFSLLLLTVAEFVVITGVDVFTGGIWTESKNLHINALYTPLFKGVPKAFLRV